MSAGTDLPFSPELLARIPDKKGVFSDDRQTIINDACFGYRYITPYLDALAPGARVLEVGAGPCLLLAQLAKDYHALHIEGIEPCGGGFGYFGEYYRSLQDVAPFRLHDGGYETFQGEGQYDLIYAINVFEHLPDWQDFLMFVKRKLSAQGKCIILCPNYGFPYEVHFGIPLVFTPRLTYAIFNRYITRFEKQNNCHGLWDSLNFVKWSKVKRSARRLDLAVRFHSRIVEDMVDRLDGDREFARRQKWLGVPARILKRTGLIKLLHLNVVQRIHPYMFLEFQKASS